MVDHHFDHCVLSDRCVIIVNNQRGHNNMAKESTARHQPRKDGRPKAMFRDDGEDTKDETTQQPKIKEENLDDFLRSTFGTTSLEPKEGQLPSIGYLQEHFRTKSAIIR